MIYLQNVKKEKLLAVIKKKISSGLLENRRKTKPISFIIYNVNVMI